MNSTVDHLLSQLSKVVEELEGLATAARSASTEQGAAVTDRLKEALAGARNRIHDLEHNLQRGAKATDDYVHENAWTSIAVAAAIAFLVGVLSRHRD